MANLRTNNLSGEQGQNAYRGSVFFNATPNAGLQMQSSDFAFGVDDFTVEGWFWYSGDGATIASIFDSRTTDTNTNGFFVGVNASGLFYTYGFPAGTGESTHNSIPPNSGWHHFAIVRSGNDGFRFLNGQQVGSTANMSSTNYIESGGVVGQPSNTFTSSLYRWKGYLSNIRVHKGEAIYTSNFTPPTTELKATSSNCVLLCCQDSDDPTQDATGKTITAQNLISDQPKVIPPFGVDAGNTFGGPIQQSSQGYMYFPTGRTEERGGARGLVSGGFSPGGHESIDFTNIQSDGNAITFGDLSVASGYNSGLGSRTRGVITLQYQASPEATINTIEFVTIATTSNTTNFGDMATTDYGRSAGSNDTRGIISGGSGNTNAMEFITIATLGNGSDFGDLTQGRREPQSTASSTRLVTAGGYAAPSTGSRYNIIDFVTIATTGNAQDFGDLTSTRWKPSAFADPTRGVFTGGNTPSSLNVIDFITIASTGDATDFGDLTSISGRGAGCSDHTRGITFIGQNPANNNIIEVVTIQTTGNSKDFGDRSFASHSHGALSNGHGGLP